jgi:transposase-like protein
MRGRGAKRALTPEQETQVVKMYTETQVPVAQIAKAFDVCAKTVYNTLGRARENEMGRAA